MLIHDKLLTLFVVKTEVLFFYSPVGILRSIALLTRVHDSTHHNNNEIACNSCTIDATYTCLSIYLSIRRYSKYMAFTSNTSVRALCVSRPEIVCAVDGRAALVRLQGIMMSSVDREVPTSAAATSASALHSTSSAHQFQYVCQIYHSAVCVVARQPDTHSSRS